MGNASSLVSYVPGFLYQQLFYTPVYPTSDCSGQVIIVTGSNVGLGLDAAKHFVRLNAAKVILAVRTESKGEDAKKQIIDSLGADPSRAEVWKLDMSSNASVKAFADRVNRLDRLDAVVENAGVMTENWSMMEGEESHMKVNLISTFLLALLLLPKLRESGRKYRKEGKLVLVGSDLHLVAKFQEQNVKGKSLFEALNTESVSNISDRYE
jgi:NAD(P)-dependent dehydrogenase (short-subunit alcohol dehydrogenase family)